MQIGPINTINKLFLIHTIEWEQRGHLGLEKVNSNGNSNRNGSVNVNENGNGDGNGNGNGNGDENVNVNGNWNGNRNGNGNVNIKINEKTTLGINGQTRQRHDPPNLTGTAYWWTHGKKVNDLHTSGVWC